MRPICPPKRLLIQRHLPRPRLGPASTSMAVSAMEVGQLIRPLLTRLQAYAATARHKYRVARGGWERLEAVTIFSSATESSAAYLVTPALRAWKAPSKMG